MTTEQVLLAAIKEQPVLVVVDQMHYQVTGVRVCAGELELELSLKPVALGLETSKQRNYFGNWEGKK